MRSLPPRQRTPQSCEKKKKKFITGLHVAASLSRPCRVWMMRRASRGQFQLPQESCLVRFSDVGFMSLSPVRCFSLICLWTFVWWSFAEPASRSCVNHSFLSLWSGSWSRSLAGFVPLGVARYSFPLRQTHLSSSARLRQFSTDFLVGEGHCEVHHSACNCDAVQVEDTFVDTFVATLSTIKDAGQKLCCFIDSNACFFTDLRGSVVTSTCRSVGSHRP